MIKMRFCDFNFARIPLCLSYAFTHILLANIVHQMCKRFRDGRGQLELAPNKITGNVCMGIFAEKLKNYNFLVNSDRKIAKKVSKKYVVNNVNILLLILVNKA